jgi:hypothetical protein
MPASLSGKAAYPTGLLFKLRSLMKRKSSNTRWWEFNKRKYLYGIYHQYNAVKFARDIACYINCKILLPIAIDWNEMVNSSWLKQSGNSDLYLAWLQFVYSLRMKES